MTRVDKVWGYEEIIVNLPLYCSKFLHINQGFQCSLHYHKQKDETFYVSRGTVNMEYGNNEKIMGRGELIRIKPGVKHRFTGLEDSIILEISTEHNDFDSYRVPGELSRYVGHRICYIDCPLAKKPQEIPNSKSEVKDGKGSF